MLKGELAISSTSVSMVQAYLLSFRNVLITTYLPPFVLIAGVIDQTTH